MKERNFEIEIARERERGGGKGGGVMKGMGFDW